MHQKATKIRAKKLGVLMYDARLASRRTPEDCAKAMGVSLDVYQEYESGEKSPSLPELEVLAYYYNIPLDHFWGNESLSEKAGLEEPPKFDQIIPIRHRMIGALLRQARSTANMSLKELSLKTEIPENAIISYELGEEPIPAPELDILIAGCGSHLDQFIDKSGPVGLWRTQQQSIQKFQELPTELQEFVCKPVNRPYVELALRLSELSVERLRAIAEGLLEITY
jgi:transcriptional regulator with XRE-family HTH domain